MQKTQANTNKEVTWDISVILRALRKFVWVIVAATILFGVLAYIYSATMITPTYRSGFTTYVNNRVTSQSTTSASDMSAAMGLAYVYQDIIISRSVLKDAAARIGEDFTFTEVYNMVSAEVSEDAPIISVYVEAEDPELAAELANAIAEVAPEYVNQIVEGSSMKIIDVPTVPPGPYSPSKSRNALLGAVIGLVLSAAAVVAIELLHDQVQDADDLENRYDLIVLGNIPDIAAAEKHDSNHHYGYGKPRSENK